MQVEKSKKLMQSAQIIGLLDIKTDNKSFQINKLRCKLPITRIAKAGHNIPISFKRSSIAAR
jgi:hypothetical protein